MEQEDYTIRLMRKDDIDAVVILERQLFLDPWTKQSFETELKNVKHSFLYVIEYEKKIIAYIAAWCYAGEIHIGNIAVVPEFRRRGLAERLLNYVFEACGDCTDVFLEVRESNTAAFNLYKKIGFDVLGVRRSYYRNGEDALVMKKIKTG
jgi:ribosomal-protein-alanine N-acetyltransferase